MSVTPPQLRVLVVDDSAYNRQTIASMLEAVDDVQVVGRAMNGKEALRLAFDLRPDVITLDLEMPEMDGFAFLRLLMNKQPTPVIVISGYARRENVFRALELGALDFIAKPGRQISPDLRNIADELGRKIRVVSRLQTVRLQERARKLAAQAAADAVAEASEVAEAMAQHDVLASASPGPGPRGVLGVASSTGGPPAIQQLLGLLSPTLDLGIVIAQHMPARFTHTFAQRLDKMVPFRVTEARDEQLVQSGVVYIAPGASNVHLETTDDGQPRIRVVEPDRTRPGLTPSADELFKSASQALGSRFCALVLTGMGSDGTAGAREAKTSGSRVFAEDPETAVMPGMPYSVVEAGVVDAVRSLEDLPELIAEFAAACDTTA